MKMLSNRHFNVLSILFSIIINGVVPLLLYKVLKNVMPTLPALILATLAPLIENLILLLKRKRFDVFGLLMLGSIVLSIVLASFGGNEKLVLIRESYVTVAIGSCFIISLFFRRPLIFYLAKRFVVELNANKLEERWNVPYFRYGFRLVTLVWGISLLADGLARIFLVYYLSTELFLVLSNLILYGTISLVAMWTIGYRRYAMKKYKASFVMKERG